MQNDPTPDQTAQLQRSIYLRIVHTLRKSLPPPAEPTPEALDERDQIAIAQVAALVPANPDEAELAALAVGATAQAAACLEELGQCTASPAETERLRRQAARAGREARGWRAMLLRHQWMRMKREATDATCTSASWTEHCMQGLLTNALRSLSPAKPAPASAQTAPPADAPTITTPADAAPAAPLADAPPVARPADAPPAPPAEPPVSPEEAAERARLAREADEYARIYPLRARRIRQCQGLPPDCDFGPPDPDLVQAIATGDSPGLRMADAYELVAA